MNLILIFVCGVIYELTSTYWLFATEKLQPSKAAMCSMMQAIVMLTGIEASIGDLKSAACFVTGYALGSAVGVKIEARKRANESKQPITEDG